MAELPGPPDESTPAAPKRATTRRRASVGRRASSNGTSGRATTRRASATGRRASTAKRASAKASTTARKRTTSSATGVTAKRRGRPPGSRNKRTTVAVSSNPADAMSKRISDLINENRTLKARVNELEAGWKKIESALGSEVKKARRTVKRTTRAASKKVEQAISAVTG